MSKNSPDSIRQDITAKIVSALSAGTTPWRQPWKNHPNAGIPANFQSKRRYTGINTLILMCSSLEGDYHSRFWGSSSSVMSQLGGHVKKGEKSTYVTFFKMLPKKNENGSVEKDKKGNDRVIPLLRQYPIFNIEQFQAPTVETLLDGRGAYGVVKGLLGQYDKKNRTSVTTVAELRQIAIKYIAAKDQPTQDATREQIAEAICQGIQQNLASYRADVEVEDVEANYDPADNLMVKSGAVIKHGGNRAFYNVTRDYIQLPNRRFFDTLTDYYQTAFHELAHWTKPEGRVGRSVTIEDQTASYAFEELIAELASCFTLTEVGVPLADSMMPKSQSYLAHWLKTMENDPKYIFTAATQASKIVDYLLTFVGKQNQQFAEDDTDNTDDQLERGVA